MVGHLQPERLVGTVKPLFFGLESKTCRLARTQKYQCKIRQRKVSFIGEFHPEHVTKVYTLILDIFLWMKEGEKFHFFNQIGYILSE